MADLTRKTANLFDVATAYSSYYIGSGTVRGITVAVCNNVRNYFTTDEIGKTITISVNATQITASRMYITANIGGVASTSNSIYQGQTGQFVITVTPTSTDDYWKFSYGSNATEYCELNNFMVNVGSTALPYEPYGWLHSLRKLTTATDTITTLPIDLYADGTNATVGLVGNMSQTGTPSPTTPLQPSECGDLETSGAKAGQYKIPISSASTTTPVYLGEVQSTRKIKKLVLTGEEAFTQTSDYQQSSRFRLVINDALRGADTYTADTIISTHYKSETGFGIGTIVQSNGIDINCTFCMQSSEYPDLTTFKAYLAAQYTAGTPVTIWYVLATETTGIVNEPLRKIGDYVDTVSGITIPTITGKDTFDVETTLKPSEVELTYTGWHDATVKEWDGSQWNE